MKMTIDRDLALGRLPEFDEKSREYPIRAIIPRELQERPRSRIWSCRVRLNQNPKPKCVGFSWGSELAARPIVIQHVDNSWGDRIYALAQDLDEWPGTNYDGSSVLGGAKAVSQLGYLDQYRWAFSLDDLVLAISHHGPAVLGINWYYSMDNPDDNHIIHVEGNTDVDIAGGHAILDNGQKLVWKGFSIAGLPTKRGPDRDKCLSRLHNTWGADWGDNGECWISFNDLDRLLHEQGEACIPVHRLRGS